MAANISISTWNYINLWFFSDDCSFFSWSLEENIDVNKMSEDAKCLADRKRCWSKRRDKQDGWKELLRHNFFNIPEFKWNIAIFFVWIPWIISNYAQVSNHNYFKSIGIELAELPFEIMGFMFRPIVKPIFFSANHNLFYSHFPWQFIRNLLRLQNIVYLCLM